MNSRKNNIQVASYDISYDIRYTCSDNAICQLSKTSGVISKDTNTDFFNLTITPNTQLETGDRVTVEIEATSTSNYKKTIKGKFTLVVGQENLTYQITDAPDEPYMNLRITNTLSYYVVRQSFDNYTVNQKRLEYLEKTIKLIDIAGRIDTELKGTEAQEIIKVININEMCKMKNYFTHLTLLFNRIRVSKDTLINI